MLKNKSLIVFAILALFFAACPVIAQSRKFEKSKLEALAKELDSDTFTLEIVLEGAQKDAKYFTFSQDGQKYTIDLETLQVVKDPQLAEMARRQQEDPSIPYSDVYKKPIFNGGDVNQFLKWVKANINYPSSAAKENVEERISVSFIIDIDGRVKSVSVIKNEGQSPSIYNYDFEKEAIRVVSSSPLWEPGRDESGAPVKVQVCPFPVYFYLSQIELPTIVYDDGPWHYRYAQNPIVNRKTIEDRDREIAEKLARAHEQESKNYDYNSNSKTYTFSTPLDVFNFLQSRVFKSSDGITLDISPYGVTANGRTFTGAVQVTYIQQKQAILKASAPGTGHTYTFIADADKNCIVCKDDDTMYFGK